MVVSYAAIPKKMKLISSLAFGCTVCGERNL